jgi:hypothetical protein
LSAAVVIRLSPWELEIAAAAGVRRRVGALSRSLEDRYGAVDGDSWGHDIEGAAAEMAVAKLLGRFYVPALHVQANGEGDVAQYQVRSTIHDHGCLLVKTGDADADVFILVTGRAPVLTVRGWIRAGEGKRSEWWREVRGRTAFFVPQYALTPLRQRKGVAA